MDTSMKSLVILAAGMWSRYGGLKQLDGFGPQWETILEYSMYDAIHAWFEKIIFVIREEFSEQFSKQIIEPLQESNPTVVFVSVYQWMDSYVPVGYDSSYRQKPWGTAHAVLVAKDEIDGPFCVINADDRYWPEAYSIIHSYFETHLSEKKLCMVWYILENTLSAHGAVNRGICEVVSDELKDVNEHLKLVRVDWTDTARDEAGRIVPITSIVSMNFRWFHKSHIDVFETLFSEFVIEYRMNPTIEFFIPKVVDYLVQELWYTCEVLPTNDPWCGVTYVDDKPFVEKTIQQAIDDGLYPIQWLWTTGS